MAAILRMKMIVARPSMYRAAEKTVRPSLQVGVRSYAQAESTQRCTVGSSASLPSYSYHHLHRRCYSQSIPLFSSAPATKLDATKLRPSRTSPSSSTRRSTRGRSKSKRSTSKKTSKGGAPPQKRTDVHPTGPNILPMQSTHTTHILWQTISPHVEFRTLQQLNKHLSRIISRGPHKMDVQDRAGMESTLQRRLNMMFGGKGGKAPEKRKNLALSKDEPEVDYSWSARGHPWLRQTLHDYFMGKLLDKPDRNASIPLPIEDPTYPPNRNMKNYDKHLAVLKKAREACIHYPIFWTDEIMRDSGFCFNHNNPTDKRNPVKKREVKKEEYTEALSKNHERKSQEQLDAEAEELLGVLIARLPPPHFTKLMSMLDKFANLSNVGEEDSGSNSWIIDEKGPNRTSLKELPETKSNHTDWKRNRIPILGKFLKGVSASHSTLIAIDLARFLYVDIPEPDGGNSSYRETDDADRRDRKIAAYAFRKQKHLHSNEKRYNKKRDEFIQKMMALQHEFAHWSGENLKSDVEPSSTNPSKDQAEPITEIDDDVTSDLDVKGLTQYELIMEQKDALAETLIEMQKMGLRSENDIVQTIGRPKRGTHLKFTAIQMDEKDDSETQNVDPELEERIVFVNNLPIDTTEEEIDQIYSRCGPLESIELFGLRPDLDPGKLSKRQLKERRQQKLRKKNIYPSGKQKRPRTPVYGVLRFKDDEGYKVATSPELCIFGCVIRRHPVMSIKTDVLKKLYIENISGVNSLDLEYKLARTFEPQKLQIMQDGMRGVGISNHNGENISMPSSCQLSFDNFLTAWQAYHLIKERGDYDGATGTENDVTGLWPEGWQVNWFSTPPDAMAYWTREIGF